MTAIERIDHWRGALLGTALGDAVGAMAGALVGALVGADRWPDALLARLEARDDLVDLADHLAGLPT